MNELYTLGFRGEALASVAAVSKVEMLTKREDEEYGTRYIIEGSEEILCEKSGCPDGTTIVIRDIFYNVPARMKFLKSDTSEGNAISSIVKKISLSNPNISFKFIRDNKQELCTSGNGELYSVIYAVFGKEFAASMLPVDYTYESVRVHGFTVKPTFARANRAFQTFFVNSRYIKSLTCTLAMDEAYKNSIMTGKFPACVLMIEVSPSIIDVNVHPAKTEVRFSNESLISNSITFAVKNALLLGDSPNQFVFKEKPKVDYKAPMNYHDVIDSKPLEQTVFEFHSSAHNYQSSAHLSNPIEEIVKVVTPQNIHSTFEKLEVPKEEHRKVEQVTQFEQLEVPTEIKTGTFKYINSNSFTKKNPSQIKIEEPIKPIIRIIGEVFMNFVIAEVENEMILIDKHAAHERLIFEKIKNNSEKMSSQMYLSPRELLMSDEQYAALLDSRDDLSEMGFALEFVDEPRVKVLGIPSILDNVSAEDILLEIADKLLTGGDVLEPDALDDIYHSIACKAAIKAHDKTSISELKALVEEVYNNESIRYCPHGRPVMITITKYDIEKQFKRIV